MTDPSPLACVVVQVSELEGHEGDVTALSVVPPPPGNAEAAVAKLATNFWTAGLDGELIYWDFATAELVRKVHVGLPVHSMVSPPSAVSCRACRG
jgi:NET1-associated nuclear protein 1 (U3 small nucleolar RNA-associated protein 17)